MMEKRIGAGLVAGLIAGIVFTLVALFLKTKTHEVTCLSDRLARSLAERALRGEGPLCSGLRTSLTRSPARLAGSVKG
ncbi:MAG: hypothetical protein DMD75_14245 [Candidatus Rokuibacteriota bacterium]|nr:MAG: hypothetical protein DMD75_14245 [Candidatus Rokubacteria bacterium]